jgi:HAD superfamily hydrolase (TIGR01509 family)
MTDTVSARGPVAGSRTRAIVFDLDGVLVNSSPCHSAAFKEIFAPFGIHDFEYSRFAGWRTRDVVEKVLRDAGCAADAGIIDTAAARKSQLAREKMAACDPVVPGCADVLRELSGRGYTLALASSGSPESVSVFLDSAAVRPFFQSVLTGGDVRHAKPDPEIYQRTCEQLRTDPADCLVVEDAVAGVVAARRAGAAVIGVRGACSREELVQAGAMDVLSDIRELPAWLSAAI